MSTSHYVFIFALIHYLCQVIAEDRPLLKFHSLPKAKPHDQGHIDICVPAFNYNCSTGFTICYPATVLPIKEPMRINNTAPEKDDDFDDFLSEPEEPWDGRPVPNAGFGFMSMVKWPKKSINLTNIPGNPVAKICENVRRDKGSMYPGKPWHGLMVQSKIKSKIWKQLKLRVTLSFSPKKYDIDAVMVLEKYCLRLNLGGMNTQFATMTDWPYRGRILNNEVEEWRQNKTNLAISLIPLDWKPYKGFRHYVTVRSDDCSIGWRIPKEPEEQKKCEISWEGAKPALIRDLVASQEANGQIKTNFWKKHQYVVRVGFLAKPQEVKSGKLAIKSFDKLQNSVRQHGAPEWIQRHSYILDYFNPNVRDLLESIDFDYAPIPEEWVASGIEVLVHRCDGAEFLSQARKAVGPVMNQSYDWTNDFTSFELCCMIPTNDQWGPEIYTMIENQSWPIHEKWERNVKVGIPKQFLPKLHREQLMALKYKFGLSLAKRAFYLGMDYRSKPFWGGHLFVPGEYVIREEHTHHVQVYFQYFELLNKWEPKIKVHVLQMIMSCKKCLKYLDNVDAKDGNHTMPDLTVYIPRLFGAKVGKDGKTNLHMDLISAFDVNHKTFWNIKAEEPIGYDTAYWRTKKLIEQENSLG